MAFMNKIGNILKQTTSKLSSPESSTSNASIYQAIRCFSSKLFIGGLSYATDENSLRKTFAPYGNVIEARIIVDRESGRSKGFGFVSYPSAEDASAAIQALDGRDLHGRFIRVAYATDHRGASHSRHFSGGMGYGAVHSNNGGNDNFSNGGTNYCHDNSQGSYGNLYESVNSNSVQSTATCVNGVNIGPDGDYWRQDCSSSGGSGNYGFNAGDNFGGNDAPVGRCNSDGGYSSSNSSNYDATYGGTHSLNSRTLYNGGDWQGGYSNMGNNVNVQDGASGNTNDNGGWNEGYGNARVG